MRYLSCSASIFVCMQHIVNLSMNTSQLKKYIGSAYNIRMRWLMRCTFKIFKMEATLLDENDYNESRNGYSI